MGICSCVVNRVVAFTTLIYLKYITSVQEVMSSAMIPRMSLGCVYLHVFDKGYALKNRVSTQLASSCKSEAICA